MSRVSVLSAGVSGHTAASYLRKRLSPDRQVIVVSPKPDFYLFPSNIWMGVGRMHVEEVLMPLAPIYRDHGVVFKQARALCILSRC